MSMAAICSVALVLRHHILWKIFIALLEQNETFFGQDKKKFFYDCGTTFYSIEKLFDRYEGEREFQLQVVILIFGTSISHFLNFSIFIFVFYQNFNFS